MTAQCRHYIAVLVTTCLQVSHGAIQFAAYEELKSAAANYDGSSFAGFTSSLDAGAAEAEGDGRYSSSSTGRRAASSSGKARGDSAAGSCGNRAQRQLSPAEITACGALAKLIASVATYPTQVGGVWGGGCCAVRRGGWQSACGGGCGGWGIGWSTTFYATAS